MFKIGKSCTPSELLSDEVTQGVEVLVTWGGGMGGASKRYYTKQKNLFKQNSLCAENEFVLELVDGTEVVLNRNFVVSKTPVRLITVVGDITGHINHGLPVNKVKKMFETRVFALPLNEPFEIVHDFVYEDCGYKVFGERKEG